MAKNKQNQKNKPDSPKQIDTALEEFNKLSSKDKFTFLRRGGVFFLSWGDRLVSPTPELRGLVNQVSRLANMCNMMFDKVSKRQVDVTALTAISEQEIQSKITTPTAQAINEKIKELQDTLDKERDARSGGQGQKAQAEAQSQSEPDSAEAAPEADTTKSDADTETAESEDEDLDVPVSG